MASKAAPSSRDDPGEPGDVTGLNRPENDDFPALGVFAQKTGVDSPRSGGGNADLSELPVRSTEVPIHRGDTAGGGLGGRVLVLNASFEPINVCTVRRAIVLILKEKAEMVDDAGYELRAEKVSVTRPSVIRLVTYVRIPFHSFRRKITRRAVFARDGWQCQYCGRRGSLTMDHIVPRSKGGDTSWDNVVACCAGCNRRKGDRSVSQAGMHLLSRPGTPHPTIFIHVASPTIPSAWQPYVPSPTQSVTSSGGAPAEAAA
jgi:5-methylcytosine-specific restriction endonuclease McrA